MEIQIIIREKQEIPYNRREVQMEVKYSLMIIKRSQMNG